MTSRSHKDNNLQMTSRSLKDNNPQITPRTKFTNKINELLELSENKLNNNNIEHFEFAKDNNFIVGNNFNLINGNVLMSNASAPNIANNSIYDN